MTKTSSKKIEKSALNKIENMIDEIEFIDYHFNSEDTGISWDGTISLYHGNIDNKENFDGKIDVQVKGRSTNNKNLFDKWKFALDKRDLENYNKVDGTLLFIVRFKNFNEYKVYYKSLLPKNIRDLLKEQPNGKNEILIKLKEVTSVSHLEAICRNFQIDHNIQKKLSDSVFENSNLTSNNNQFGTFSMWSNGKFNPLSILGEEKFIYFSDKKNNIIDVQCAEINEIVEKKNMSVTTSSGKTYYDFVDYNTDLNGVKNIYFGKAFNFQYSSKKFNVKIAGTLSERIKQLNFVLEVLKTCEFFINNVRLGLKFNEMAHKHFQNLYDAYIKIKNFCIEHNIKKDINLDIWSDNDINQLLIWIDAIDNNKSIQVKEWDMSVLGSIQLRDIRFSVLADIQPNNSFRISSIWNSKKTEKQSFTYCNGEIKITTTNIFSVLNPDAYESDDINIDEMINVYNTYKLSDNEDILINFQSLAVILAYDKNKNIDLLMYAEYLLNKFYDEFQERDILDINLLQIKKRQRNLTEEELKKLLEIKNSTDNPLVMLSANILLENKIESKILFNNLSKENQEEYLKFPIANLFEKQ